jgi:RNA polymerase sigma factor (sigma-70 family)
VQHAPGSGDHFEDWEIELIRREAEDFWRNGYLRWSDADDLETAGQTAWWHQRARWDSAQSGASHYLRRVVRNAFKDVAKAEGAGSRQGAREAASLDEPTEDSDAPLGDFLSGPDEIAAAEFWLDVRPIWDRLTPRQRTVVLARRAGYQTKALAGSLGLSRDTLYEDLQRIQSAFRAAGFEET